MFLFEEISSKTFWIGYPLHLLLSYYCRGNFPSLLDGTPVSQTPHFPLLKILILFLIKKKSSSSFLIRSCISENIFITLSHLINSFAGYRIFLLEIYYFFRILKYLSIVIYHIVGKSDATLILDALYKACFLSFSWKHLVSPLYSQGDTNAQRWCVLVSRFSSMVLGIIGKYRNLIFGKF